MHSHSASNVQLQSYSQHPTRQTDSKASYDCYFLYAKLPSINYLQPPLDQWDNTLYIYADIPFTLTFTTACDLKFHIYLICVSFDCKTWKLNI